MKKQIISIFLLLLLIFTPLISWLFWYGQEDKEMNILILDKTVLNKDVQEHSSLNWILNHERILKPNGELYNPELDYFGFFPDEKGGYEISDFNDYREYQLDSLVNSYDMLYYTDLYGIYVAEWWDAYPEIAPKDYKKIPPMERSRHIYGRLTPSELYVLRGMKEQKKLIMTEFNIIASPTHRSERKEFEQLFSMEWSKWVGRYFDVLDTTVNEELPGWVKRNYVAQYGEWPFEESGIVFVRNDDRIVIVENGKHLENEVPYIHTSEKYCDIYGIPEVMKYSFWFDICSFYHPNTVISNYHLTLNREGDSILSHFDIPTVFPAVVKGEGDYPFYYFAGDFSDNPIGLKSSKFKKSNWGSSFSYSNVPQERVSFFWDFYRPLTTTILNDYYSKIQKR